MQNQSIQQDVLLTQNSRNFNQFLAQIWLGDSTCRLLGCLCNPRNAQPHVETKVFVRPFQGLTLPPVYKPLKCWEYSP